jgi:hypothetical protein
MILKFHIHLKYFVKLSSIYIGSISLLSNALHDTIKVLCSAAEVVVFGN